MAFIKTEKNGVPLFMPTFGAGVQCAVSTRHGGVSKDHLGTLNLGLSVSDSAENVYENQRRFSVAASMPLENIVYTKQEHTDKVVAVDLSHGGMGVLKPRFPFGVDGLITNTPHLPLFAYSADCPVVLFYDSARRAIGICHSGWRGTVKKIAAKTIQKMTESFGTNPADVMAAICPSIGACCFLVDTPVYEEFCAVFPEKESFFAGNAGEKYRIDLTAAIAVTLKSAGVFSVQKAEICTACHDDMFFSHRKSGGKRGLFGAAIMLTEGGAA